MLLQRFQVPQPGGYVIIEPNWQNGLIVEVQGSVNENLLAEIASFSGLQLQKVHSDKFKLATLALVVFIFFEKYCASWPT